MAALTERGRAVLLLEEAVGYGLGSVEAVTPARLRGPTPCAGWDLERLLWHLHESMAALREASDRGGVALLPAGPGGPPPADPVAAVRDGAGELLESWRCWAARPGPSCAPVAVGGMPIPGETVALVGALEVAVHGWDVAQACGRARPIPAPLALAILRRAPQVADAGTRPALFAAPVPVPPHACAGDRLVAFLGRPPDRVPPDPAA
ncbi:TIGR03086 family metal-binding protein [Streptomyces sp. NPDC021020]|uniref:TIGR03086 family metal-binding protein n=1 Tax=Streptomyces sp. NPDC021020 TaxID=3365109 RepID=UPI0037B95F1E